MYDIWSAEDVGSDFSWSSAASRADNHADYSFFSGVLPAFAVFAVSPICPRVKSTESPNSRIQKAGTSTYIGCHTKPIRTDKPLHLPCNLPLLRTRGTTTLTLQQYMVLHVYRERREGSKEQQKTPGTRVDDIIRQQLRMLFFRSSFLEPDFL